MCGLCGLYCALGSTWGWGAGGESCARIRPGHGGGAEEAEAPRRACYPRRPRRRRWRWRRRWRRRRTELKPMGERCEEWRAWKGQPPPMGGARPGGGPAAAIVEFKASDQAGHCSVASQWQEVVAASLTRMLASAIDSDRAASGCSLHRARQLLCHTTVASAGGETRSQRCRPV